MAVNRFTISLEVNDHLLEEDLDIGAPVGWKVGNLLRSSCRFLLSYQFLGAPHKDIDNFPFLSFLHRPLVSLPFLARAREEREGRAAAIEG